MRQERVTLRGGPLDDQAVTIVGDLLDTADAVLIMRRLGRDPGIIDLLLMNGRAHRLIIGGDPKIVYVRDRDDAMSFEEPTQA